MSSMAIIKQLDVFKDSLSSLSSIGIFFMMGTFGFETVIKGVSKRCQSYYFSVFQALEKPASFFPNIGKRTHPFDELRTGG